MKKCKKCNIEKVESEFYKTNKIVCKVCIRIKQSKYRKKNKEKIKETSKLYSIKNKKKIKEYRKKYYCDNKDILYEKRLIYRDKNKDSIKKSVMKYYTENIEAISMYKHEYYIEYKDDISIYNKEYRINHRDERNLKERERKIKDPLYRLTCNIRIVINSILKNNNPDKKEHTIDILGCTYTEFITHLNDNEYNFNYSDGIYDLDHIIPLSTASCEEELIKLNHYANFQLLPSYYNRCIKSDKEWNEEHFKTWLYNNYL